MSGILVEELDGLVLELVPVFGTDGHLDTGPGQGDRRDARLDEQALATTSEVSDTDSAPSLSPSQEQAARDLDDSIGAARSRAAPPDDACVVCHGTGRGPYCWRCRATGKEPPGAPPVPVDP